MGWKGGRKHGKEQRKCSFLFQYVDYTCYVNNLHCGIIFKSTKTFSHPWFFGNWIIKVMHLDSVLYFIESAFNWPILHKTLLNAAPVKLRMSVWMHSFLQPFISTHHIDTLKWNFTLHKTTKYGRRKVPHHLLLGIIQHSWKQETCHINMEAIILRRKPLLAGRLRERLQC